MAKVVRYSVRKESHLGDNNFLVHRGTVFGNPFTHIKDRATKAQFVVQNRNEAISLYEDYFDEMIKTSPQFKDAWDKLYEAYKTHNTIYLGCYCNDNETCHGDVILKKLKNRSIKEMLNTIKENSNEGISE